jgi:hypothetical protein
MNDSNMTELADADAFHLPIPDANMPLRPITAMDWSVVEEHFRPWVQLYQQHPHAEAERLKTKVYQPFVME